MTAKQRYACNALAFVCGHWPDQPTQLCDPPNQPTTNCSTKRSKCVLTEIVHWLQGQFDALVPSGTRSLSGRLSIGLFAITIYREYVPIRRVLESGLSNFNGHSDRYHAPQRRAGSLTFPVIVELHWIRSAVLSFSPTARTGSFTGSPNRVPFLNRAC